MKLYKLADVLNRSEKYPWNYALYLPFDEVWTKDTRSAVLDPNNITATTHSFIQKEGLKYALTIQTLQDIVINAREQIPAVSIEHLLDAFLHYYDNDAFIDFANGSALG